jgi:putative hydrolase of the HAD superfamily
VLREGGSRYRFGSADDRTVPSCAIPRFETAGVGIAERMPVDAVAFDLDYTLAVPDRDRSTLLREAVTAAGDPAVADAVSREGYVAAHTRNADSDDREPIFADLLADHDADPAVAADAYREGLAASLRPVAGVEDMLASLGEDYRLGLLTDGPGRAQRDKLDALGWTDRFDAVVVTGDLGTRKPDRAAFEALLDGLGTAAARTVYVGDRPDRDVGGAVAAGLRAVQVLGPDDDPANRADAQVHRGELAAALPRLLGSF